MGARENFTHNLKKAMRQHEADRRAVESLVADLEYFYEVDITNCTMTHSDWIRELAKAMTLENYKQDFLDELKEYRDARDEIKYF